MILCRTDKVTNLPALLSMCSHYLGPYVEHI